MPTNDCGNNKPTLCRFFILIFAIIHIPIFLTLIESIALVFCLYYCVPLFYATVLPGAQSQTRHTLWRAIPPTTPIPTTAPNPFPGCFRGCENSLTRFFFRSFFILHWQMWEFVIVVVEILNPDLQCCCVLRLY